MEFMSPNTVAQLAFIVGIVLFALLHWRTQPTLPLPPGPPAEFLLGHARVIPKENTAAAYARWSREYNSDVIHVNSLGRSIVVLNSVEAAKDVLEKKGANFCDRPRFTLLEVNTNVRQWHNLQITEARRTVRNMIRSPSSWGTSLRRLAVAIVLQVSYGTEVPRDNDPYIQIANDAMYATGNGGAPANSIVDLVPLARYLPDCIVRDWSLQFARQWRWAIQKLHDVPFAAAQAEDELTLVLGKDGCCDNTSLAHQLLRQYRSNEANGREQEWSLDDIKGAAGAVFIAGADTTWATCVIFILNMVLHPEIQEKARSQLDSVIGPDRLPNFSDRASLPYIEHIVQEIYRWSPLAPLGIPHKSLRDDVYKGMFIPKGTTVVYANAHAMAHDERIYRAPHDFNPDRYEPVINGGAGEPFPVGNFGFGRRPFLGYRVCVGRFLADNSVWIMVATMLATLRFRKKTGPDGRPIEPRVQFTNGGTCHPEHFDCVIDPRSYEASVLVGADDDDEFSIPANRNS
ncbi:cytochrome P450 [Fusarium albosuccineum]|uniref:Cytochrome P450 n=1 Tax=Fusarium albosuccineum TaxID=1237068 RepID=A0A8H4LRC7_9HYPO|nr:cytochrome P450 [Fusarium albosuccineum]